MKIVAPEEMEEVLAEKEQKKLADVDVQEQGFVVPLLSKGKHGYPDRIRCRPLKVKDVKGLLKDPFENEVEYVRRLVEVVQNTVLEPRGLNLFEITMPDFKKILLAHRINSIGASMELWYVCECKEDSRQTVRIDLMRLKETEIPDEYVEPVRIGNIQLRYPRLWGWLPEGKRSFDEVDDFDVLRSVVVGCDVDELSLKDAKEAIEFVRRWEGSYGLQDFVEVPCKFCKKKISVAVPWFLFFRTW